MSQKISFGNSFSIGFSALGKSFGWQILYSLVFWVVLFISALIFGLLSAFIPVLPNLLLTMLFAPLSYGFALLANDAYTKGSVEFGSAFKGFGHTFKLFGLVLIQQIVTLFIMIGGLMLLMGESVGKMSDLFMELSQAGFANTELAADINNELGAVIMDNIGSFLIVVLITLVVSILFIFPPFYAIFKNQGIGDALSNGVRLGAKNLPVVVAFLIVVMLMTMVASLIPILNLIFIFLVFIPFIYCMLFGLYRSAEPDDMHSVIEGVEDVLDMD